MKYPRGFDCNFLSVLNELEHLKMAIGKCEKCDHMSKQVKEWIKTAKLNIKKELQAYIGKGNVLVECPKCDGSGGWERFEGCDCNGDHYKYEKCEHCNGDGVSISKKLA